APKRTRFPGGGVAYTGTGRTPRLRAAARRPTAWGWCEVEVVPRRYHARYRPLVSEASRSFRRRPNPASGLTADLIDGYKGSGVPREANIQGNGVLDSDGTQACGCYRGPDCACPRSACTICMSSGIRVLCRCLPTRHLL